MKLIIDIPEQGFSACKLWVKNRVATWQDEIIAKGTPITDDCISREWLKRAFPYTDEWYKSRVVAQVIDNAPTIGDEEKPNE